MLSKLSNMPRPLEIYAPQRTCPNCHKEKVYVSTGRYDSKTLKLIKTDNVEPAFWGLAVTAAIYVTIYAILPFVFHIDITNISACIYSAPIIGFVLAIAVIIDQHSRAATAVFVSYYRCHVCGYRWEMRSGKP